MTPKLWDSYGRPLRQLRILVTCRCNYRCIYCHGEGALGEQGDLPLELVEVLAEAARRLGVEYYKVTGGEPLLHPQLGEVLEALSSRGRVSITTNGYLLREKAQLLAEHTTHVNVSLPSVNPARYERVTGVDALSRVLEGARALVDAGGRLRVNTVVIPGVNDDEIEAIVGAAEALGAEKVNLIRLARVGRAASLPTVDPLQVLTPTLTARVVRVERLDVHNRVQLTLDTGIKLVLIESGYTPCFCAACDRLRVTCTGKLQPCLEWSGPRVDLAAEVVKARSWEDAVRAAEDALRRANRLRRPKVLWPVSCTDHCPQPWSSGSLRIPPRE